VAHAETAEKLGPLMPSAMATLLDGMLGMTMGTQNGLIALAPRSESTGGDVGIASAVKTMSNNDGRRHQ